MKYLSLIFLFFQAFYAYSQNKDTDAVISGRILLPNLEVLPINKLGLADIFKLNSRDYSIKLDTSGYFHIKIPIDNSAYLYAPYQVHIS